MKPNYDLLPEHIRAGVQRYIEQRIQPGDFLTAVIQNDLKWSFALADKVNREKLFDILKFFHNEVTSLCWGSPERMEAWLDHEES